jgi:23S rRNA pseudouridine2605 synthase
LIKNRKRRENTRDDALGKLSTRPEKSFGERGPKPERSGFGERGPKPERPAFGGKPARGGKKPEREQRPIEPPGQRKANVWMAPGARPIGKGRAEAEKAEVEAKRSRKEGFAKPGGARPFGKPRNERPGDGGGRPFGKGPGKGPKAR